jgi:hypothetical protein
MFLVESVEQNAGLPVETLTEILVEANVTYGNLVQRMMAIEHKAIITENAELLTEGVSEWWAKFVAFIKKLWAKIKNFFSNLWTKILGLVGADEKWIERVEKEASNFGTVKVDVHEAVANGATAKEVQRITTVLQGIASKFEVKANTSAKEIVLMAIGAKNEESVSEAVKKLCLGKVKKGASVNAQHAIQPFKDLMKVVAHARDAAKVFDGLKGIAIRLAEQNGDKKEAETVKEAMNVVSIVFKEVGSCIIISKNEYKRIIQAGMSKSSSSAKKESGSLFDGIDY